MTRRLRAALACSLLVLVPAFAQAQDSVENLLDHARRSSRANDYGAALESAEQALDLARAQSDAAAQSRALSLMGKVLIRSGARTRGAEQISRSLAIAKTLGQPGKLARAYLDAAGAHNSVGQQDAALKYLDQAQEIISGLNSPRRLAEVDSARANVLIHAGRYVEAIFYAETAIEALEAEDARRALALARARLAYAEHQIGGYEQALVNYELALPVFARDNNQTRIQFVFCNRAEILWSMGEIRPAEEDLHAALERIERARARTPVTADERAVFLERQVVAYDRLIRLLADTYRGIDAFEIAERFHARSFLELLDEQTLESAMGSKGGDLGEKEREALARLGEARLRLEEAQTKSGGASSVSLAEKQIVALENELSGLVAEKRRNDPRYASLVHPEPPGISTLQQGLAPSEVLVAYWVSKDRLLAWTVSAGSASFTEVPIERETLRRAVTEYLAPLRSRVRAEDRAIRGEEAEHIALGLKLHGWLLGALPRSVREAELLIVVPDDFLHYLPFESLIRACPQEPAKADTGLLHGAYASCQFTGLEQAIVYNASAGSFLALRERAGRAEGAARLLAMAPFSSRGQTAAAGVFANAAGHLSPLMHAAEEVCIIAKVFPESEAFTGAEASEARFKSRAGQSSVIHLATHGMIDDSLAMSSGVLLAPGDGEDGLLQAHEVVGLKLEAELVTLSACRTGRGSLQRGEGIIGISRSFLYAGAASVLVSLWDVDDAATPALMQAFYRRIHEGMDRANAMKGARKELFARRTQSRIVAREREISWAHPRFWAPFVLTGIP